MSKARITLRERRQALGLTREEVSRATGVPVSSIAEAEDEEDLSAFYEEAKIDRVFTNSVFWVVTRTNDCFY